MGIKFDARWSHGLDEDDHKKLMNSVATSLPVLEKLKKILEDLQREKGVMKESDYDKPSWPFWRADRDGYFKGIRDAIKLIPELEKDDHDR